MGPSSCRKSSSGLCCETERQKYRSSSTEARWKAKMLGCLSLGAPFRRHLAAAAVFPPGSVPETSNGERRERVFFLFVFAPCTALCLQRSINTAKLRGELTSRPGGGGTMVRGSARLQLPGRERGSVTHEGGAATCPVKAARRRSRPTRNSASRRHSGHDREDDRLRERVEHPGQEPPQDGDPGLQRGGQDGHRLALFERARGRAVHADRRGLPPEALQHPRERLPAGHFGHVREQASFPCHEEALHPHRRRVHSGVQSGQPRLLPGGAAAQAADLRDQVAPEEQDQGERRGAAGHLRQQVRPRVPAAGAEGGGGAAGGRRRGPPLRLLRGLGQEEHRRGPHVPGALRHGQAAGRDEPRPPLQGVAAVVRAAAPQVLPRREVQGRLRHRDAVRAPAQRPQ